MICKLHIISIYYSLNFKFTISSRHLLGLEWPIKSRHMASLFTKILFKPGPTFSGQYDLHVELYTLDVD